MAVLSSVIGRGTLAGRPAAGNAGRLYFATDGSGTMYRDNGSSWDSVETSASGLADQGTATYLDFAEAAAPGTPASGKVRLYAKADGSLYQKDDAGTETGLAGGGGGSSGYDLDTYSIDATYGDDFTGAALAAAWTRRNYVAGDETYQVGKNATYLRISKAGQAAGDGYFRTAPTGDWTFAMAFVPRFYVANPVAWGVAVVDTNGTGVATCFYNGPIAPLLISVTTYSTYGGSYVQVGASGAGPNVQVLPLAYWANDRKVWVYLRKSGTSYYTAVSFDGEAWSPESSALTWTGTVDRIGMMDAPLGTVTTGTGDGTYVDVDWFNKIA